MHVTNYCMYIEPNYIFICGKGDGSCYALRLNHVRRTHWFEVSFIITNRLLEQVIRRKKIIYLFEEINNIFIFV